MTPSQVVVLVLSALVIIFFIVQLTEISEISSLSKKVSFFNSPDNSIEAWVKAQKALDFVDRINEHERMVFSQEGEDGVIEVRCVLLSLYYLHMFVRTFNCFLLYHRTVHFRQYGDH